MAKGKKKPASKPKAKKTEPILKDEAIPVEDIKVPGNKKKKAAIKDSKPKKKSHSFPEKEECKHLHTKRTIDRRLRVMHVCTNPTCKKIVRFGGR